MAPESDPARSRHEAGTRPWPFFALLAGLVLCFAAGRYSVAPPECELRAGVKPGWVSVYRRGELAGEYDERDGAAYDVLAWLLFYDPPLPARLRQKVPGPPLLEPGPGVPARPAPKSTALRSP